MATNKHKLFEQVIRRLKAGDPSVASNVHEAEIKEALMQVLNSRLRLQYFEGLQLDESIPDGCVIATYDSIPVVAWNGVSKSTLPAIPVSLPKNIGVWRITPVPYTSSQLSTPTLSASAVSDTQINVVVGSVANALTYSLERSTDLNNWVVISNVAGTFNDTGRTPETTYYYRVKAVGNGTTYTDSNYKYSTATTEATPFVPTSLPNLWVWLDANAGVTQASSNVSAWADQSGNGHNLSLGSVNYPVSYVAGAINSLPAIRSKQTTFGGTPDYGVLWSTVAANIPKMTRGTLYFVVKRHSGNNAIAGGVTSFALSGINFTLGLLTAENANAIYADVANFSDRIFLPNTQETWYTIRVRFTDVNNGAEVAGAVNNGAEVTGAVSGEGTDWPFYLFGEGDYSIAEALVFTSRLSNSDSDSVENYLRMKYAHY